ncbi:MAG: NAD(P)-dependent oxidoreductase [Alkalibacterium sp.]|nr:NAD(P)-dependent oxidoreductase [Alkalibacterium sp.]
MKKLLLTGAAGRIGSRLIEDLADEYELILTDRDCSAIKNWAEKGCTVESFDITHFEECLKFCEGVDTVIHLAGNPSPLATYDEVKKVNIDGTYNMMQAAKNQGCRRLIFASSIHAVKGYPQDEQVKTTSPIRPKDVYGVSKAFGEAMGNYFAYQQGLEVIAIRIGGHRSIEMMDERGEKPDQRERSTYISAKDMNQLIRRCIEAQLTHPFEIAHGVSDNTFKFLDLSDTKEKVGYEPDDNGFEFD